MYVRFELTHVLMIKMELPVHLERKYFCTIFACDFDYGFYFKKCELVKLIVIIVQVVIGVIGNGLSLLVWIRGNRCSKLACSMYFRLLAATDIIVLIVSCGFPFIYEYYKYGTEEPVPRLEQKSNYSDDRWFYVSVTFIKRVGPQISPWLLTVISIERMLSLCFPFKFQLKGCKKRAIKIYVCILVVILGMGSNIFYIDRLVPGTLVQVWGNHSTRIPISLNIEDGLKMWSLCVLPLGFMVVCNLICLIQIFKMRGRIASVNVNQGLSTTRRSSRVGLFTAICLASGLFHCVSVLPTLVHTIHANRLLSGLYDFGIFAQIFKSYLFQQTPFNKSYLFLHTLAVCTLYLNNSVNFFVFCVSGKDFRRDLRTLLVTNENK